MYKKKIARPDEFEKMWIVSKTSDDHQKGKPLTFLCSDGIERTMLDLIDLRGIHYKTIFYRIRKHGLGSPLVLHPGPLNQAAFEFYGLDGKFSKYGMGSAGENTGWNTGKCRRNKINCDKYSECQASRLKMVGAAPWVAPANTDTCFMYPSDHLRPYSSGLSYGAISVNLRG